MTKLKEKDDISQEFVRELFEYRDGLLYWKKKASDNTKIGDVAGYVNKKYRDRRLLCINYKRYYNYRIVFLYHKGYIPKFIDHIDHDTLNDRIENLRDATKQENSRNSSSHINSFSEYLGVSWHKNRNCWVAQIGINGKNVYLGRFDKETNAALAYNCASVKHFGEFANLNIIKPPTT